MSSRNLDGCRVLKAAEERLAFAQKCEATARGELDAAKSKHDAARKEVKAAKSFLEETRGKLQVINVDDVEEAGEKSGDSGQKDRGDKPAVIPQRSGTSNGHGVVEQIEVEQAGTSEANGIYKRCHYHPGVSIPGLENAADKTAPIYSKRGFWQGYAGKFLIYRGVETKLWRVVHFQTKPASWAYFYHTIKRGSDLPPKETNGWMGDEDGTSPAPLLKY